MLRAAALALLLALPSGAAELFPAGWSAVPVATWGGLNLLRDSTAIGEDAQVAQNILTDNGYLEKRPGNVILGTILPGYPVKFVTDWVSPSGTRYVIAHASDTIYQTDFSGDPVALSTAQPLFNISFVPAFGRAVFADGYRAPWFWTGTSTGTVADTASGVAAPICTYLAFKDSRVFCANIPNEGTSRVRISSTGGMGYWVVPADVSTVDNAPNVFDFTPDDGDSIKCMQTTPWGVFVGKQYSSWMIKGTGNISYELRILDPKVGCKDNRSVQMVYGVLQWLSNDGIYAYDGSGPPRLISRELDPLVANLPYTSYGTKFWLNDTQADWTAGNLTASGPGAPVSATALPGGITVTSATLTDNTTTLFAQGTCEGCSNSMSGDIQFIGVTSTYNWRSPFQTILPTSQGWADFNATPVSDVGGSSLTMTCPTGGGGTCYTRKLLDWNRTDDHLILTFRATRYPTGSNSMFVALQNGNITTNVPDPGAATSGVNYIGVYFLTNGTSPGEIIYHIERNFPFTSDSDQYEALTAPSFSTYTIIVSSYGAVWFYRDGVFKSSGTSNLAKMTMVTMMSQGSAANSSLYVEYVHTSTNVALPSGVSDLVSVSTFTSRIFDTQVSTPTFGIFVTSQTTASPTVLSWSIRTSTSPNNDLWSSYQSFATGAAPPTGGSRYAQYRSTFSQFSLIESPGFRYVTLDAASTAYYNSAVHLIGSAISSYGIFTVTQNIPTGSTVTWQVRATTYSFTDASGVNIPWTAQTANQVPTIVVSTPTYFQFRAKLDFNYPANIPSVSRLQTNWNEGTGNPVSSGVIDRRYHLCVTISSAATIPDTCLIRQKNGKWVTWTGPSVGAMGTYNYNLVAADGDTSSKLWTIMSPGVYNDDGEAIDSQWVSADFTNGLIFNEKVLHEFWVDALPVSQSSVTLSYQVDKSSGFTDYQFYLDNGKPVNSSILPSGLALYGNINQWVPLFKGFESAKYFRIKFSDSIINNYWRINSYLMYLENQSRSVPN